MKPSDFQKTVQCRFESCLKKVVRSVVKDYYKELNRRKNKEISFSELPDVLVDKMAVWDDYETDYTIFSVCGIDIRVLDDELAEGRTEIIYYVIPLIATVSMAVVSDFRDWRIPNRLIAVGMIQGFLMSAVVRGPCDGLLSSVAGCVIPVVILFVLFHKKALGAGDIKLLATAGTFVGTDVIRVIVYSFLAGGVISLFFLLKEVLMSVTNRKEISTKQFYRNLMKSRVHFSAAIMGGVMYYVCTIEWR